MVRAGFQMSADRSLITRMPPEELESKRWGAVFKVLKDATGLNYERLADALNEGQSKLDGDGKETPALDVNTIKRWAAHVVPSPEKRRVLEVFVRAHAHSEEIADAWWQALTAAWEREEQSKELSREENRLARAEVDKLVATLQARVLADRQLNQLPPLFETDVTLPLATTYVELRIAPATPVVPQRLQLEQRQSLAEKLKKRAEQRFLVRRAPQQALDQPGQRCRLILGAPGTGKSSLLRRLALDIAGGKWATADLPLFVEARAYAQARRLSPGLTLVDYACRRLAGPESNIARLRQYVLGAPDPGRAILLVDGLDEIASDPETVATIYGELGDSSTGIAWIVTARPAGLMQALNEDLRFEMAELDPEAIAALVENWCAANAAAGFPLDARMLHSELGRVPGMREMATNPFLLTALCFLKSTARNEQLPNSRIAVYETLLERIAHQAQSRRNDHTILSPAAQQDLSEFACHLYRRPQGVVQIFTASEWHEFVATTGGAIATDFERHIVPGRLLTVWSEADPQYHFLHLTLHEHMVARAMLDWPVTDALAFRFHPAWRSVFRFYGALLWQRGRPQQFAELTAALFQSRDVNSLSLITLAEVFADAGLRDTTRQLGTDLRQVLLELVAATGDHPIGTEAFIDALALLDPDWLVERTAAAEDDLVAVGLESTEQLDVEAHFRGQHQIQFGQTFNGPYRRLGRSRNASALAIIEAAFWGDDQDRALMAATAFAEVATPEQCHRAVEAGMSAAMFDDLATRIYAFCLYRRSSAFLPFLERVIQHFAENGADPFAEAMSLVADTGGTKAAAILEARLLRELTRHKSKKHQIEVCARALARLGGPDALGGFDNAIKATRSKAWRTYLTITRDSITPDHDAQMMRHLAEFREGATALRVVADVASFGRLPSDKVVKLIGKQARHKMTSDGFDLAILERHRIEAGAPAQLCGPLLAIAKHMLRQLRAAERGSPAAEGMTFELPVILDVLGQGRWLQARGLFEAILSDRTLPSAVIEAAIQAAGLLLERSGDAAMLRQLEDILFDDRFQVDPYDVTLAIGRIDLERLFQRRGAITAASTLQHIAAERDEQIFETEWVDRSGTMHKWVDPPRKVLYGAPRPRPKVVDLVAHELSRFNLCMELDWPADCCVALVIFEPLPAADRTFSEMDVMMIEREGGKTYRIPTKSVAAARKRARTIGNEIADTLGLGVSSRS